MLSIATNLPNEGSASLYRQTLQDGYRWLRFKPPLEQEFQAFYVETHISRLRWSGCLAIALYSLFLLLDLTTLPPSIWHWTIIIRLGLIIPAFSLVLWMSYRADWRPRLSTALSAAALLTGLGTNGVIAIALAHSYPIPYEGILLVALFIYFIACMPWWSAVLVNLITIVAFVGLELCWQTDASLRLYHTAFMLTANALGAAGSYFLEFSTRGHFLANSLLRELAERDSLTGLYNRRMLNRHLHRAWQQAQRTGDTLAVAMIDVDHFKRYNDRYGHASGDEALQAVANAIAGEARRPLDFAARYGGEEFLVVWYQPTVADLPAMGERLKAAVTALALPHADSQSGRLSISIGISMLTPADDKSAEALLRLADMALYAAKEQGRDRVEITPAQAQQAE